MTIAGHHHDRKRSADRIDDHEYREQPRKVQDQALPFRRLASLPARNRFGESQIRHP